MTGSEMLTIHLFPSLQEIFRIREGNKSIFGLKNPRIKTITEGLENEN